MSTPINDFTARDIAGTYSYGADRVQLLVVDEATVLAIGYREDRTATGRVASIYRDEDIDSEFWVFEVRAATNRGLGSASGIVEDELETDDDLDALMHWLRGDA